MATKSSSFPLPPSLLPDDLSSLPPPDLAARGRATVELIDRSHFEIGRLLAYVHKQPRRFGYVSAIDFAEAELQLRERLAYHLLKLDHDSRKLPKLREAYKKGEVGVANAREVAKIATAKDDGRWTEIAKKESYRAVYSRVHKEGDEKARKGEGPWPDTGLYGSMGEGERVTQEPRPFMASLKKLEGEVFELHNRVAGSDTSWREFFEAALLAYKGDLEREIAEVPREIRAILDRDEWRCRVPGCSRRADLQRHHVKHRAQGGSDRPENLCCLCAPHHRSHHEGLLEVRGDARTGFGFRHRAKPDDEWRDYPRSARGPYDPMERAWDGPSYVREADEAWTPGDRAFNASVTFRPWASPGFSSEPIARAGPL